MNKLTKMGNTYVDALRGKEKNTKTILSPRRQIVERQKSKCYICERNLGNAMCYFAEVEGPDMDTGINSKETRAICPPCFFALGKNPVKQVKKTRESEKEKIKAKEKKSEEEELNLFKELKLKYNNKEEMWDKWK